MRAAALTEKLTEYGHVALVLQEVLGQCGDGLPEDAQVCLAAEVAELTGRARAIAGRAAADSTPPVTGGATSPDATAALKETFSELATMLRNAALLLEAVGLLAQRFAQVAAVPEGAEGRAAEAAEAWGRSVGAVVRAVSLFSAEVALPATVVGLMTEVLTQRAGPRGDAPAPPNLAPSTN